MWSGGKPFTNLMNRLLLLNSNNFFFILFSKQLYLEASMSTKRTNLVKPFAQVSFIILGLLCALSRIFDYWHHWGDVLVGLFLGTIVAFFIVSVGSY